MLPVIGQPLRVKLDKDSHEHFQSRLIEIEPDGLLIDVPLHQDGRSAKAEPTQGLWIEYHARDGAVCRVQTRYLESVRSPGLVWKLSRPQPNEIIKEQRREFVRVPADLQVTLYHGESGHRQETVFSTDISGGGMAILMPRSVVLSSGSLVRAQFILPTDKTVVTAKCFVVRVGDRNERGYAPVSLQFIELNESLRSKIIQYTFARQRIIGRK